MSYRKMMLVINPAAGRRTSEKNLSKVCRIFLENGWHVTSFVTGRRGEATEYVRNYADGYDRVACMGGDGTLNEVVNGLMQGGSNVPVAFIPC